MVITEEQEEILERIVKNHPEIGRDKINTVLYHRTTLQNRDYLYIGGAGIFAKFDEKDNLVKILTYEEPKLPNSNKSLFDFLFGGYIYHMETSSEYNNLISFVSNISGAIRIFYNPDKKEFYISPAVVNKAYNLTIDNKVQETEIPGFAKEDKEQFDSWYNDYKIFLENKDKPSKSF